MTLLANINVGSSPNDGTGDSLRTSFITCNENFQLLDTLATEFISGNLNTNVNSNGTSTFNIVVVNSNITSNLFSGNGSALTNVTADYAQTVLGNSQTNITSIGTLGNLAVAGTIISNSIESATIGNTDALLVGTITTSSQPFITSLGNLTSITMQNPSSINGIHALTYAQSNEFNIAISSSNVRFWTNTISRVGFDITSNLTLFYPSPIESGVEKYIAVKNTSGSTKYVTLPNDNNNKASNTIPIAAGAVATIFFLAFDDTSSNVVASIIND